LAVDNIIFLKSEKEYDINNFSVKGEWISNGEVIIKADLINYSSDENVNFITASYENNKLVDVDIKRLNVSKLSEMKNISSDIKLGKNAEDCEIKAFVWNENMNPYCFVFYPMR